MPNAIVTGASSGLGLALAAELVAAGYDLTLDGRRTGLLEQARSRLVAGAASQLAAVAGDVADPAHRTELVNVASTRGLVDLLVHNASELGGSPPPRLDRLDSAAAQRLWRVNVDAPLQLVRAALPVLADGATIVSISSDAAVEHYPGWGGYGATKAALDHLTLTWAAERPEHTWYAVDPGDMRTPLHQAAFPGEDISDRPAPETVAPRLVALISSGLPSGRYRLGDLPGQLAPVLVAEASA